MTGPRQFAPVSHETLGPGSYRTVEGRLTMADFTHGVRRCCIESPPGDVIPCVFEESQDAAVAAALAHYVRVTGEYVKSRRKTPDLLIHDIKLMTGTGQGARPIPRMPKDPTLEEMAAAQGKGGPTDLEKLMNADFWPEDEDTDEFVATIRKWRDEG